MRMRLYIPVFSLTLLLSASLLFSIQPMFSKMILPLLGGTPQVWNTAMLFFQMTLLAGYAYAHGTSHFLNIRTQAIIHIALLVLFFFVLPFGIPDGAMPSGNEDPLWWQIGLMVTVIGGPFFVLSGSAPMFQRWFAGTDHPDANNPYFLYGASNLGSMASLLAYPFLIEPAADLQTQAWGWMIGYAALIIFCVFAAILAWNANSGLKKQNLEAPVTQDLAMGVTWKQRGFWLLMAFLPSSLMLGVTTYITTDIASVPLLWIIPLSLYVATFIIVFARKQIISKENLIWVFGLILVLLVTKTVAYNDIPPLVFVTLHLILFFFAALLCHQELADSRPNSKYLTEFYLIMSIGGALGGVFNALIAPKLFFIPVEYPIILLMICFIRYVKLPEYSLSNSIRTFYNGMIRSPSETLLNLKYLGAAFLFAIIITLAVFTEAEHTLPAVAVFIFAAGLLIIRSRWLLGLCLAIVFISTPPGYELEGTVLNNLKYQDRNFFGVLRVTDYDLAKIRVLMHGTTTHGSQPLEEEKRLEKISYYSSKGPFFDIFSELDKKQGPQKVAVIGLGIGVMACYTHPDRHFDFYEIDPAVVEVAENKELFTYLSDCGSPYDILLGDGRLRIQDQPDGTYDVITLDAFSSDNIPVHLLTLEALELYRKKLKPDGVLLLHISNNYLDLEPVVASAAKQMGLVSLAKIGPTPEVADASELPIYHTHLITLLPQDHDLNYLTDNGWTEGITSPSSKYWTDQYSNIFSVLGQTVSKARFDSIKGNTEDATPENVSE